MKVLIVSQYFYPEHFSVTDIALALKKRGHEVTVLTAKPNYGYGKILDGYKKIKEEVYEGINIKRVNIYPRTKSNHFIVVLNYLSFYFNARRFARHFKDEFDVVLSFSYSPVTSISPAIVYAKKHHIPHVLFCMDLWPESTVVTGAIKKGSLFYRILYRWSINLYKKCDLIMVSSPSFINYFHEELKLTNLNFKHVYQPALYTDKVAPSITFESKYNIIYGGNIGSIQLVDKIVEAMKLLKGQDITLHLAGLGSKLDDVMDYVKKEHLEDIVKYHGILQLEEVEQLYKSSDALIVSLKNSGTVGKTIPNKAIQYMKYSRPILGILKGDGYELLKTADGTIFSNEDPESIANAIKKVCYLPKEEKERLGNNNKKYFDENLSLDKIAQSIEDCLKLAKK